MPGTTKQTVEVEVELKGPRSKHNNEPYNKFLIQYTVTKTRVAPKEVKREESDRTLVDPLSLGLNPALLSRCAPVKRAASKAPKATIRDLKLKFPYWGHLIYNSIREFNASSPNRCRKLVYDLRHGEADHNAWKKLFIEQSQLKRWTETPEYKRWPIIDLGDGKKYCIIDPPLTASGEKQAKDTNVIFRQLKDQMFPIPKRAYISPLLRAIQTFKFALKGIGIRSEDSYILNELREKETGNCADILIDEYISHSKKPPKAGTNAKDMEDDKAVQKRAASLHDEIFRMDDSDCIVRVTHSLLIQNNLIGLEVGGGTVLQKFMLAEGGLFAYVVEGKRTNKEGAKKWRNANLETVAERKKRIGGRRKSTFQVLKAPTKPDDTVTIEQAILAM